MLRRAQFLLAQFLQAQFLLAEFRHVQFLQATPGDLAGRAER